jgi:hypothetical protein
MPALLTLALTARLAATVGVVPVELVGFDDKDVPAAVAAVDAAVVATGHAVAPGPAVDEACATDGVCVAGRFDGTTIDQLLRLSALRVGGDVEVKDTLYDRGGAVLASGSRLVTVEVFLKDPLSSEVGAVLVGLAPPAATTTTTTTTRTTAAPGLPPGVFVAGAGGLFAAIGLVGFGVEAATLEDPSSQGSDKERARAMGWVYLGLTAIGVGAAAGGVAWALLPDESATSSSTPTPPTTSTP